MSPANASTTVMATVDSNTCRVVVGVERGAAVLRALNRLVVLPFVHRYCFGLTMALMFSVICPIHVIG